jgi:hypothetical protein
MADNLAKPDLVGRLTQPQAAAFAPHRRKIARKPKLVRRFHQVALGNAIRLRDFTDGGATILFEGRRAC